MQDSTQNEFLQDKTTIFMACDGALDFALANMIIGLKRYNENLIDKIYVFYDDFDDETLSKISSIWSGKIIFQRYSDEDFCRDIENNKFIKNHPGLRRYSHFNYAKFYIFDILEKANTQSVIFLDIDMLCTGCLQELLKVAKAADGFGWLNSKRGGTKAYFDHIQKSELEYTYTVIQGGLIAFSKNIFQKAGKNLTQQCFEIFRFFGENEISTLFDEAIFGIIGALYDFKLQDVMHLGFNYCFNQMYSKTEPKIVHSVDAEKFWTYSSSFWAFQEWGVNHKIWVHEYGGKDKVQKLDLPLNLSNQTELYHFLDTLQTLRFYLHEISCLLYGLEIAYLHEDFNFGFRLKFDKTQLELKMRPWVKYARDYLHILVQVDAKDLQKLEFIARSQHFELARNHLSKFYHKRDKDKMLSELKALLEALFEQGILKSKMKELKKESLRYSAVARVRNHLAYRLGAAIIVCNKSLWGLASLPFVLSFIKAQYKKEQAAYQNLIKQKPEFKLPKIENYPDYKAALKEKECLTYKLGEAMMRADKAWYKFGYVKFYVEAKRLEKEFKNK